MCMSQQTRRLCGRSERCNYAVDAEDELAPRPPCFTAFPLHPNERAVDHGPARMGSFTSEC
jgi:hypothetical protein